MEDLLLDVARLIEPAHGPTPTNRLWSKRVGETTKRGARNCSWNCVGTV